MTKVKPRILIVDDEPVICDLLSEDLDELGYSCDIAPNGNYALKKMAEEAFNIVLLDIRLPGISGIDLLREIKQKYITAVIMITALDDVNTAVISMKLGASDYLIKPFNLETLSSSINSALVKNNKPIDDINVATSFIGDEEKELREMDAIANGIEVKLDISDKRSTIVIQKTIETAKELGISDKRIEQWKEIRVINKRKKLEVLDKFNRNAIAQIVMGVTETHQPENNSYKTNN